MIRLPHMLVVLLALVLLAGFATPALGEEITGKIKSVAALQNEFVLTDKDGVDQTFQLAADAKVMINDKESKLEDLTEGDEVTIVIDSQEEEQFVKEIRCLRK